MIPAQTFAKKSQQYKLGYELFKVTGVRPTKGDHSKSILLYLTDQNNEPIQGVFRLDEVRIVPTQSIYHPKHPSYKPTISELVEKVKIKGRHKYKVKLAGNTYTELICLQWLGLLAAEGGSWQKPCTKQSKNQIRLISTLDKRKIVLK